MNADEEEEELVPPTGTVNVEEWISIAVGLVKLVWDPLENSLRCRPSLLFDDVTTDESQVKLDGVSLFLKLSAGEVVVSEMNSETWTKKELRLDSE